MFTIYKKIILKIVDFKIKVWYNISISVCFQFILRPMNLKNLAIKHKKNTTWPMEKKIAAVTQYLVLGNMNLVAASTGIDVDLLRHWKMQPWWTDTEKEIRATENIEVDGKLTKIVDRSLDAVMDRLENGDFIYNNKTGQIIRKPVNMKDAVTASKEMLTKRELLRGNATERKETTQISMQDQLKALALEFAKFNKPTSGGTAEDVIDVEAKEIVDEEIQVDGISDSVFDNDQPTESNIVDQEEGTTSS